MSENNDNFFKRLVSTVTRTARQILGLFPSALPQGVQEFHAWTDSIVSTWDLPTTDRDSLTFMLGSMIMHAGPTEARKPKYFYVLSIRAAAAKQVAGACFHEVKLRQQAAQKAQAEATALQAVAHEPQK